MKGAVNRSPKEKIIKIIKIIIIIKIMIIIMIIIMIMIMKINIKRK